MTAAVRDGFDVFVKQDSVCSKEELSIAETESMFSLPYHKDSGM